MRIGSLVICVMVEDEATASSTTKSTWDVLDRNGYVQPKLKEIYTVRGFTPFGKGIYLEEIVNPPLDTVQGYLEVGWRIEDFREIQPPMSLEFIEEMQHPLTLLQTK